MSLIKGSERNPASHGSTLALVCMLFGAGAVFAQADQEPTKEKTPQEFPATHQQTAIIKVLAEGESPQQVHSFCVNADGNILAALGETPGEIRVLGADGKRLASWESSVKPEAINVGPDGSVFVAGGGKILKLSSAGKVLLTKEAPHAGHLKANAGEIRAQIVQQAKQRTESMVKRVQLYETQIDRLQNEIDKLTAKGEDNLTDTDQKRIEAYKKTMATYRRSMATYKTFIEQNPAKELTEEEIQAQVKRMIESKLRVSSVSATKTDVYVACRASEGYGFDVWRTDLALENGKKIIEGLRGCCGQMDVRANGDAIYVAENSRQRVGRYDRQGKMTTQWGKGIRTGVKGFGSCCNPMNVAFGTKGEVYTAEATSGRIKCYDADGKLLCLVGSVDLVPGCKNVSIAVCDNGDRIYMLDITRNHIVVMTKKPKTTTVAANRPEIEG